VAQDQPVETLTVDRRRAIFRALVEAQDEGMSVEASRADAARKFAVTESDVKAIEREGLENEWPPL
jgi:hypothetical protein